MIKHKTNQSIDSTEEKLQEQILSIKKMVVDYKSERKESWILFKDQVKDDLRNLKKALQKMSEEAKKK